MCSKSRKCWRKTTEAVSVIMRKGAVSLGTFYDIKDYIWLADKGSVLTMKQLLQILYNLHVTRNAASFLKSDLPELPIIKGLAGRIERTEAAGGRYRPLHHFGGRDGRCGQLRIKEYQKKHTEAE